MIKSYIKYFTLFLIIILLNSNFSFAITQMMCKMSEVQTSCECETDSQTGVMKISSEEKACCKIHISEINNSNTLEKNNIKVTNHIPVQSVIYQISVTELTKTFTTQNIFSICYIPIPDIPVINSSFLI